MRTLLRFVAVLAIAPTVACGPRALDAAPSPAIARGTSFAPLGAALVRAIAANQKPRSEAAPPAPLALTASDGSGLILTRIDVAAVVTGPIAVTELRLTFHNPEPRRREGRFAITLPTDAAVNRFAMKNEAWLEAEVVPRQEARRVYETFLHQRVDPALLEKDAGNTFSARVFPIEASADKELILGYTHTVSGGDGDRIALAGLPAVGELRWSITVDGVAQRGHDRDRAPTDLLLASGRQEARAVTAGDGFLARVTPPLANQPDPIGAATILIDTSASRASLLRRQADAVRALCAAIARRDPSAPIVIVGFDQSAEVIARGPARSVADGLAAALDARGGLGASDLGAALDAAAGSERVILLSDGIATIGERDSGRLAERIRSHGIGRLDAVTIGAMQDRDRLAALTTAAGRAGAIVDGEDAGALAALDRSRARDLTITVAGATAVWPPILRGAGSGEAVIVAGRRRASDAPLAITFGDGDQVRTVHVTATAGPAPMVARAVARAELTELDRTLAAATTEAARAAARAAIERLGVTQRLVTSQTSLLVLETDADYARFCIPRDARSDILTIVDGVVEVIDRSPAGAAAATPCDPPAPIAAPTDVGVSFSGATSIENTYAVDGVTPDPGPGVGEVIVIDDRAPSIDPSSTRQGITIVTEYSRNIPIPGRSFEAALGTAPLIDPRSTTQGLVRTSDDPARYLPEPPPPPPLPYEGRLLTVMQHLRDHRPEPALTEALAWYVTEPTDLAAMIALGESLEARGAIALAARAYGSILDRFPGRVELVRFTAERLERLGPAARPLVLDIYRQAVADRPDHVSGHRLLAMAQLGARQFADALTTLEAATTADTRESIRALYLGDMGLVGAAWAAAEPTARKAIAARLAKAGARIADRPSVRFVLHWETDTNDVDLHVRDRHGYEAYYGAPELPSGGALLDDITTGYGPEAFVIDGAAKAGPYQLSVVYFARGPMGLGLGTVQIIRHDGAGRVALEARPFILQTEQATIDLGATP